MGLSLDMTVHPGGVFNRIIECIGPVKRLSCGVTEARRFAQPCAGSAGRFRDALRVNDGRCTGVSVAESDGGAPMKLLFILNDPPYGTERCYNALRLAHALGKAESTNEITIFLMADAVGCA